jgi:hypothetical protein
MDSVVEYIAKNISQGYSVDSIKNQLRQSGLSSTQINQAFEVASHTTYTPSQTSQTSQNSSKILLVLVLVGVVAISSIFAVFFSMQTTDLTPNLDSDTTDTVFDSTTSFDSNNIDSDVDSTLDTSSKTSSQINVSQIDFVQTVDSLPQVTPPPKQSPDVSGQISNSDIEPSSIPSIKNSIQLRTQLDAQVQELLTTDPVQASQLCSKYPIEYAVNDCYFTISITAKNPEICEKISSIVLVDKCYIELARRQYADMSICNKISDELKQQYCVDVYSYQS